MSAPISIFCPAEFVRVFTYIRVSGRGQLDGDGPERQRESIDKFCKIYGLKFVGEFFERAVSGTVEAVERPKFAEMLEYIDSRSGGKESIGAIVVERMDRLARDLMVSEFLLAECRKRKLKVYSADQGALIDMAAEGGDPTRVLIRQILGALSQWEKSMLVAKLRSARDRIKKTKGRCEGKKPYGTRPGEIEVINLVWNFRSIIDSYGQPMEYNVIARYLNDSGFQTRHGKKWDRHRIQHLLETTRPTKILDTAL